MIEVVSDFKINAAVICPVLQTDKFVCTENKLQEICGLAQAINLNVVHREIVRLKQIKSAAFFGSGFIKNIAQIFETKEITLVVVDAKLTPIQQRNLEKSLNLKVIDRTALILEIFGQRANTKEGTLQVELAHLVYQRSRLVRSWTHLERQRGGAGFLGGPGEKQVEIDRRILDEKIVGIKKDLAKVKQTRTIQRGARQKVPYPIVALVGYTNAGKSSLFNYLTKSNVLAENMLFATLDPTMRKLTLKSGKQVILSDTVGFISDLPHELIMAFRATLEEVVSADLILHIIDVANPENTKQSHDVLDVLHGLGLSQIEYSDKYAEIFNKADLLGETDSLYWKNKVCNSKNKVLLSALNGEGCASLLDLIEEKINACDMQYAVYIPLEYGEYMAWLYRNTQVISADTTEEKMLALIKAKPEKIAQFAKLTQKKVQIEKIKP